jgi:hypothetical protein
LIITRTTSEDHWLQSSRLRKKHLTLGILSLKAKRTLVTLSRVSKPKKKMSIGEYNPLHVLTSIQPLSTKETIQAKKTTFIGRRTPWNKNTKMRRG